MLLQGHSEGQLSRQRAIERVGVLLQGPSHQLRSLLSVTLTTTHKSIAGSQNALAERVFMLDKEPAERQTVTTAHQQECPFIDCLGTCCCR